MQRSSPKIHLNLFSSLNVYTLLIPPGGITDVVNRTIMITVIVVVTVCCVLLLILVVIILAFVKRHKRASYNFTT